MDGTRAADDTHMQIKGFASTTSAIPGDSVNFHVTVADAEEFGIDIYRLGWYGHSGARHVTSSPKLSGVKQPDPDLDHETGMISCAWSPSWSLKVAPDWLPGVYLTVFTTESGWRSYAPFVVHDPDRNGGLCVILPFSTYQAYNQWPFDGHRGKSLYYGYTDEAEETFDQRSYQVSFDRPYYKDGNPKLFDDDHSFVKWVEESGFDINYASTTDIESGRLDPANYAGVIFSGHDEYWSTTMRTWAESAVTGGTSLAYLGANNIYWKIRFAPSNDGRENRIVVCYKTGIDAVDKTDATMRWRDPSPGPADAEQKFLGVQYNGIVEGDAPLVVQGADHWFWRGCDVADGDEIPKLIGIEADGINHQYHVSTDGTPNLLSASKYMSSEGHELIQNTSLIEHDDGTIIFVAGTLHWTKGLATSGYKDARIMKASENLLNRMLQRAGARGRLSSRTRSAETATG